MNKILISILSLTIAVAFTCPCRAQTTQPSTEGPVWTITMVKTKYGMTDDYLKGLAKTFKGTLDEAKKQNIIMDYKVLIGDAANAQDYDILLLVESKNM